jgi:pimeloyl-ACP methyl ester carboxylesterase
VIAAGVMLTVATAIAPLPHTRSGKGPTIVLVHGLGGDRHVWDDVANELGKTHTVIAIDLPGHGAAPAEATLDADRIARSIAATVRAEKAAPAVIVGHSLGGFIAAHVPLVDAEVVRGLVLVDIGIGSLWTDKERAELSAAIVAKREPTLRQWFAAISKPGAQHERVVAGLSKLSNETIFGYMAMMQKQPTPGGRLTLPVLLMASPLILADKKPRAEELAAVGFAGVSKLEVVRFDQSMHWIFWDEPQKFTTTLVRYLSTVER